MKTYTVTLRRTVKTVYEVEAKDEESAIAKADSMEFSSEGQEVDCMDWAVISVAVSS